MLLRRFFFLLFRYKQIWVKVFKNGPSKICRRNCLFLNTLSHLSWPDFMPMSFENVVTRSNCFLRMLRDNAYSFRSSSKKLCARVWFLFLPYEQPFCFHNKNDRGFKHNTNSKTDRMSPWKIPFRYLIISVITVSLVPCNNAIADQDFSRRSIAHISCGGTF